MKICAKCGQPLWPGLVLAARGEHVSCPTLEEVARSRRFGRGPEWIARLLVMYPIGRDHG